MGSKMAKNRVAYFMADPKPVWSLHFKISLVKIDDVIQIISFQYVSFSIVYAIPVTTTLSLKNLFSFTMYVFAKC